MKRIRLYSAGLLAVLLGVPLTEKAFAQGWDLAYGIFSLTATAVDASGGS